MLQRLDHLLVAVSDLDAAADAYARLFGRRPAWRGEHPATGTQSALFRLENSSLALLAPGPGEAHPLRSAIKARGDGPFGLLFGVDDAAACARALKEKGLAVTAPQTGLGRDVESGAFREWTGFALPLEATRAVPLFVVEHQTPAALLPPAAALADETATVAALDHVVLRTRNPAATRALYRDALGLRLALERAAPEWKSQMLFFRVGGVTLEVVAPFGVADAEATRDELWGAAWRVADAGAAHARCSEAGIPVSALRPGRKPGTRVFSVRDGTCGVPTLVIETAKR